VTICRIQLIGYMVTWGLQCDWWHNEIPSCVPFTCTKNAIISFLIICTIPTRQISVAIHNPSLVTSISCPRTRNYLGNYVHTADDIPTLTSCKATAAGAYPTCTNFEMGSKLPKFAGIVVNTRANKYLTKLHPRLEGWSWIVIAIATWVAD